MPLEIREITIAMQVSSGAVASDAGEDPGSGSLNNAAFDREALVQECVRRVVQTLRTSGER